MSARFGLALVCLAAALCAGAYAAWWLLIDQPARIDTLAGRTPRQWALPTDGSVVAQSFPVPTGGTDAACVWIVNTIGAPRSLLVQLQADDRARPALVLARAVRHVAAGGAPVCVGIPVPAPRSPRATTWWVTLRAISAEASGGLDVAVVADHGERGEDRDDDHDDDQLEQGERPPAPAGASTWPRSSGVEHG